MKDYSVSAVIVKDLSRLGREYSYMGRLQDFIFPAYDVRFIAINDDVDSAKGENDFAVFKNVFNDYYAKDTSKKIRAVVKMRGEAGEHLASNPPYGYIKDPQDKKKWIVDEEAAKVVQRIFNLCIAGKGPMQIAKIFTADKVLTVTAYHARQKGWVMPENLYRWNTNAVLRILERREYTGCTVNFKTYTKSLKFKKRMENPVENQRVFEDTQPAIIEKGQWERVQELRKNKRRPTKTGRTSMFSGLLHCADCGAKMYNHRGKRKKDGREYGTDFYNCSTYTLTFERETQMCFSHTVSTKARNALILETIRTTASYAIQNKEEFIQKVRSISQVRQQEAAKELKRKVAKERKRSAELDVLIKKLYETYAMGKLEEKRFELLCAEYEKEQAELEQLLASEQAQLDQFHEDTDRASHFLALAQKYTDFTELTAPMIHEFVEKILVHAPDRSTGERVQEIEIYLNFIGKFEVPMPEPTEEELAAEEKRRQKRIRDHEKYLRQKERKQKIAEGLIVPGEPYQLVCQCCGEPFQSVRPNAKFCKPACREKFYRQEKRKAKETETSQTA